MKSPHKEHYRATQGQKIRGLPCGELGQVRSAQQAEGVLRGHTGGAAAVQVRQSPRRLERLGPDAG